MPARRSKTYLIVEHVSASSLGLYAGVGVTGNGTPVMALTSQEKAIGLAQRLEREARKVLPPFYVGRPDNWSSLGLTALVARLEKLGLKDLPDPVEAASRPREWRLWWDDHGGELSPEQVEAVWKLLDLVELYKVIEIPVRG